MNSLADLALTYLVNSLWQVPLVFAAAWLLARLVRRTGPAQEHTVWCGGLLLAAVLPACTFDLRVLALELLSSLRSLFSQGPPAHTGTITITTSAVHALAALHLPSVLLTVTLIAYACGMLYFTARLLWGLHQTRNLRRRSTPLADEAVLARWNHYRRLFFIDDAEIAVTARIAGPMTLGISRRLLLLPESWLTTVSAEDLDAALAHECAHMRRRDFAKNLFYQLFALPIAWHPLLWPIRARIVETREMACDALAADAVAGRQRYARSLLNLAALLAAGSAKPARASSLHAIGIFDAHNFERRVMNLTTKPIELRGLRRLITAAACIAIGAGTAASALAFHRNLTLAASAPAPTQAQTPNRIIRISGGVAAGNILTKVTPVYPVEAKEKHISGAVVLHAIIDKEGNVASLSVVSGPEELTQSATDAVRQWKYRPYLLNGNPTEVETTITVNYSLAN